MTCFFRKTPHAFGGNPTPVQAGKGKKLGLRILPASKWYLSRFLFPLRPGFCFPFPIIFLLPVVFFRFHKQKSFRLKIFFSHRKAFSASERHFSRVNIFPVSQRWFSRCHKIFFLLRRGVWQRSCQQKFSLYNKNTVFFLLRGQNNKEKKNRKQTVSTRWVASNPKQAKKKTKTQASNQTSRRASERATRKARGSKETQQRKQK